MCTHKNLFLAFTLCLAMTGDWLFAKEPPAEAAPHGATPAEPSSSGGADAKTEKGHERPGDSLPAWVEVESRIAELSAKIKNKESVLQKLIQDKKELPTDSPKIKPLIQEIVKEHKELEASIKEYEKKRSLLKYRFPERGSKVERKYKKIDFKTLDEVESSAGIEGKLNRNLKRMRSQFGKHLPDENPSVDPNQGSAEEKKKQINIEDQDPILLRK